MKDHCLNRLVETGLQLESAIAEVCWTLSGTSQIYLDVKRFTLFESIVREKLSALDREMDDRVYLFTGLAPKEIKIVEEWSK